MKFKTIFKNIFKVASKDEFRLALQGLLLHNGRLTASDGYKIVSIPCEISEEENNLYPDGTIIPSDIISLAVRTSNKIFNDVESELTEVEKGKPKIKIGNMEQCYFPIDSKFPPFEKIFIEAQENLNEKDKVCILQISVNHLLDIQKAIYTPEKKSKNWDDSKLNLVIYMNKKIGDYFTSTEPILIQSENVDSQSAIAILMPCQAGVQIIESLKEIKFTEREQEKIKTIYIANESE